MNRVKLLFGYMLAFFIGVGCNWLDIPLPAPTALLGAFIVIALTSGYLLTDWAISAQKQENSADV